MLARCPIKGLDKDGYIVEQFKQDMFWLGYSKVIIKSDHEPSLVQVVQATIAALMMSSDTYRHECRWTVPS